MNKPLDIRASILAVDDDHLCQQLMLAFLQRLGHRPATAGSAGEALQRLRDQPFRLVLLDLEMPDMNGSRLLQAIREQEQALGRPRTAAVVVSGHVDSATRQRCLQHGFDGYLSKPVLLPVLKAELDRLLAAAAEPVPEAPAAAEAFDFEETMRQTGIDRDMMAVLLRSFLTCVPDDHRRLRRAVNDAELDAVRHYAHKLKGSLGTLMAGPSVESAGELEAAARAEDAAAAARIHERFDRQIEDFLADARRWLESCAG